jgi:putative ABC transport system substrate-binding protein
MTDHVSVAGPKRVELLYELLPDLNTIALLGNPANANFQAEVPDTRTAAAALKQPLEVLTASTESELEAAFVTMVQHRVGVLVVIARPTFHLSTRTSC